MNLEILKTNAINAIAALLEAQLLVVSTNTGIDINVLHDYVGEPHTQPVPEKKKRAPPKKKVATVAEPNSELHNSELPATELVPPPEKKKRAPPKKKVVEPEQPNSELPATELVPPPEKKKRAPPKKKEIITDAVAVTDAEPSAVGPEKKKRAPPKKKVNEVVTDVAVTNVTVTEPNSQLIPPPDKKKRAPPKKKEIITEVPSNTPPNMCYLCKSISDLHSTGNSDGFVCNTCIHNDISNAFCINCHRYEETNDFTLCGTCQSLDLLQLQHDTPASNTSTIIISHHSYSSSDSSTYSSTYSDNDSDDELPFTD